MCLSKVHPLDSGDAEKCVNYMSMQDMLKPFMTIVNIAGMHMPIKRGTTSNAMSVVYSVIIQIVLWSTLCRFFIRSTDEVYTVESWMAVLSYVGFQFSGMYFGSATCVGINKHLPKFFRQYDSYRDTYASAMDNASLRRCIKMLTLFAASVVVIVLPIAYFISLHDVDPDVIYLKPMRLLPREYYPTVKAVFFIVFYVNVIQVEFFVILFYFLTYCLFKEFKQLNIQLSNKLDNQEGEEPASHIERIRRQFEDTCSLVSTISDVFMHMVGSGYAAAVPITCFMLYGLINDELMKKEYTMLITCIVINILMVGSTILTSVALNIKAHSSLMYLLNADLSRLSDTSLNIINIFITRLTTTKIGYTMYDLFTIDSSTILMLSGTLLTYVLVVLQFK
ncbi:uncharacterized protein [Haliotis cracherodii]|uniref:uncharacterized protein n=1 Tax=Haliotis cracherodii TaxID=6455 RepID=UPI0039EB9FF0